MLFTEGLAAVRADLDGLRARLDTMVASLLLESGGTRLIIPAPRAPGASEGESLLLTRGQGDSTGQDGSGAGTAAAIAQGLELPVLARRRFRADSGSVLAGVGRRSQTGAGPAFRHPAAKVSALWGADLADDLAWRYEYEASAWGYAAMRWLLVGPGGAAGTADKRPASGASVGARDVTRMRAAVGRAADAARRSGTVQSGPVPAADAGLADTGLADTGPADKGLADKGLADKGQSGIGEARQALVRRLSAQADRVLVGRCGARVNRELLAATAEATLMVGRLTYACWPSSALAQAYLIQALALAQACGDRQLGAAALCAMSQQAYFNDQLDEARELVRTAFGGAGGNAAPGLCAHLRLLTARDYIDRNELTACVRALKGAVAEFDRAGPARKPGWILWFTEADPLLFALVLAAAYQAAGLPGPAHETRSVAQQLAGRTQSYCSASYIGEPGHGTTSDWRAANAVG
jgi:hypothetical protein